MIVEKPLGLMGIGDGVSESLDQMVAAFSEVYAC
jgi:hypothetical protein